MLTVSATRDLVAIAVPAHFPAETPKSTVREILAENFAEQDLFCRPERVVVAVDQGGAAHQVLIEAASPLPRGLKLEVLPKNLGKAGAVLAGLRRLLEETDAPWLATRDCDAEHALTDLPRMVALGEQTRRETGRDRVAVFGARPSWLKPMGWMREQWEALVNLVVVDLTEHLLARQGRTLDRRLWNGYRLDLQSGYRLYSRAAAQIAVQCLSELPPDPDVYLMACEILPFPAISLLGGSTAQVQVSTRVEQPVSSYARLPLARLYGSLLAWTARRHSVAPELLLAWYDNRLADLPAFFSSARPQLLECREIVSPGAPPPLTPRVL